MRDIFATKSNSNRANREGSRPDLLKLLSIMSVALMIALVPVTLAYLHKITGPVNNSFAAAQKYTLTYHENDEDTPTSVMGMPDPKEGIVSYTKSFDISKSVPVRSGYSFKEWNTDAEGKGKVVDPSTASQTTTYTVSENETHVDLYAIWEPDGYQLTYDPNGGSIGGVEGRKYTDEQDADTFAIKSNEDLVLTHSNTGHIPCPGGTESEHEVLHLYAIFEQNYSLTYNGDAAGVTGLPATQTYKEPNPPTNSHTFTLSDEVPVNQRYAFVGWSTQSKAQTSEYGYVRGDNPSYELATKHLEGKNQITVSGASKDITLYAVWYYEYRLKYDANGQGANFGDSDGIMYTNAPNHSFRTSMTIPYREGYRFLGWATTSDATEAQYQNNEYIEPLQHGDDGYAETRLYAVWEEE